MFEFKIQAPKQEKARFEARKSVDMARLMAYIVIQ
jgi:hypothetical protein